MDPVSLYASKQQSVLVQHRSHLLLYATAAMLILLCFLLCSDGGVGFLLTLGGLVRCFSFTLLLYK